MSLSALLQDHLGKLMSEKTHELDFAAFFHNAYDTTCIVFVAAGASTALQQRQLMVSRSFLKECDEKTSKC